MLRQETSLAEGQQGGIPRWHVQFFLSESKPDLHTVCVGCSLVSAETHRGGVFKNGVIS